MDSTDYPNAIDSVEYLSASDPLFGLAAIVLLMGVLVFWIWKTDF
jgi:hypothetical protein